MKSKQKIWNQIIFMFNDDLNKLIGSQNKLQVHYTWSFNEIAHTQSERETFWFFIRCFHLERLQAVQVLMKFTFWGLAESCTCLHDFFFVKSKQNVPNQWYLKRWFISFEAMLASLCEHDKLFHDFCEKQRLYRHKTLSVHRIYSENENGKMMQLIVFTVQYDVRISYESVIKHRNSS